MALLLLKVLILLSVSTLNAKVLGPKVSHIDLSPGEDLPHLIFLENGRVLLVSPKDKKRLQLFKDNLKKMGDRRDLRRVDYLRIKESEDFRPTILASSRTSMEIFKKMRTDYQDESQCYNRAHVWAWEEYYYGGLLSKKQFLFFTSRFIRNYRYRWWFHVAPSVVVSGKGDEILDRRYARTPLDVTTWTRKFVSSGRRCPVINRYNEYAHHQGEEDCFLLSAPMYYWQPRELELRDNLGIKKKSFLARELDLAYGEAF